MAREFIKRTFVVDILVADGLYVGNQDLLDFIKYRLSLRDHIKLHKVELLNFETVKEG